MRVLLISDGAQTGFGRVGRELARRWIDAGQDVRWLAINWRGREGEIGAMLDRRATTTDIMARLAELDADPLLPIMWPAALPADGLGNTLTAPAAEGGLWPGWVAERIVVVADPRAFLFRLARDGGVLSRVPTWNYVPIEGTGLPPFWAPMWERTTPVAMSDFGRVQLEALLSSPVSSLPHGISDGFFPVSTTRPGHYQGRPVTSRDAAREAFGWGGRTVLLRTDRLVPRKDYPALFRCAAPVLDAHPEALLVIHCAAQDEGGMLPEMLSRVPGAFHVNGQWQHPQIRLTKAHDTYRGLSDADLNVLMNAADVYVSPTQAEGFGLTLAEAAACAVPVITTDYAAGPEAVGEGGVLIPPRTLHTNVYAHEWALVDEDMFTERLTWLVEHPAKRRAIGEAGARHVRRFSWDACAQGFLDLMA